jgi:hypothetical protein
MDHKMRTLIFFTTVVRKISHSKKNWKTCDQKCILTFMYCAGYSCHILIKLEFFNRFSKNTQTPNMMKIRPVGTELFHADGPT